ncbi:MAG: protoporphyrinogen oxidase [Paludibacter sp.]|nr:protoporphyrinogen oxidase [Paludibacter sp.]
MKTLHADIVIVGAGLTGLTMAYYLNKAGIKVLLLEQSERVGGVIQTKIENGFTFESGPNTGVISTVELVQLFHDLELQFEIPGATSKARWIWKKGKWHALPTGLVSAIRTPLFTFRDKVRVLWEPFRKKKNKPNESIAKLVKRRLGKSFLKYAVDPFISGIYAGDPKKLITRFALPKLYALEKQYGSFVWGAIQKRRESKSELDKQVTKEVFSVKGGLENLIRTLEQSIPHEAVLTAVKSVQVHMIEDGYHCTFVKEDQDYNISARRVVTTIDGHAAPALFPFIHEEVLDKIANIRYAKVIQVVLGYNKWNGIALEAFGGLVPSAEERDILGVLFPSALFENRAPKEGALLSVFMGGIKRPDIFEKSDDEIMEIVLEEIRNMMRCKQKPDLIKIFRYEKAIPQYESSSELRLFTVHEIEKTHPGLIIAGNVRDGIGMSDRVKQAKDITQQIITEENQEENQ